MCASSCVLRSCNFFLILTIFSGKSCLSPSVPVAESTSLTKDAMVQEVVGWCQNRLAVGSSWAEQNVLLGLLRQLPASSTFLPPMWLCKELAQISITAFSNNDLTQICSCHLFSCECHCFFFRVCEDLFTSSWLELNKDIINSLYLQTVYLQAWHPIFSPLYERHKGKNKKLQIQRIHTFFKRGKGCQICHFHQNFSTKNVSPNIFHQQIKWF